MRYFIFIILFFLFKYTVFCQLSLTVSSQVNTNCNGTDCNFLGSPILINEVMLSPLSFDGSLYGDGPNFTPGTNEGEWIELYNPDLCNPIDISCFILGNNTSDVPTGITENYEGGYVIPLGSIVPPGGFAIIRGTNAPPVPYNLLAQNGGSTIEIIVNNTRVCFGTDGVRFWLPNAGGWLALYDNTGLPLDAIVWNDYFNSCTSCQPCVPFASGCSFSGTLASYDEIPLNKKYFIELLSSQVDLGESFRRIPDGGSWENNQNFDTYGTCNQLPCNIPSSSCNGVASVSVTGGTPPYTYLWNDIHLQNTAIATQLCSGLYCVTVKDVNQIYATTCVNVQDFQPVVNLNSFSGLCENSPSFYLTGGTPTDASQDDFGLYSGTGIVNNSFNPSLAGDGISNIIYTYFNDDGCFNSDTSSITVYPKPLPVIIGELSICYGYATTLDAGAGFSNYHWSNLSNTRTITVNSAGNYSVTVTDINGCTGTNSVIVTENSTPPVINGILEFCSGNTSVLDAGSGYSFYNWNTLETTQNIIVNNTGLYSVTVTNSIGCTLTSSVNVIVNPIPDADFTTDIIDGCTPLTVEFTPFNPQTDFIYSWSFLDGSVDQTSNEMNPFHTFTQDGIFDISLVVTNAAGCIDSVYYNNMISVIKKPVAAFDFNPPYASLADPEIYFYNHSLYNDNFVWLFGDGGFSNELNPSHTFNNLGNYIVQLIVSINNTCYDTATSIVSMDEFTFYAPTAFSPDNVIFNNIFYVLGNGISTEDFRLYIFDRWGQIIYETQNYFPDNPSQYGWNGCFSSGEKVPIGSYTWLVNYRDIRENKHERNGVVNVIR